MKGKIFPERPEEIPGPEVTRETGSSREKPTTAPWQPDRGDGTYQNPVLFADYSDPDVIRVGNDYWLTASSFNHVPGLPILHSHDLVNWLLVNHALPQLVPKDHFAVTRHGCGVWAPSIRHHLGRYWIYYPDPDFGIYVVTALHPGERWSEPQLVKPGRGLIDPCPFWDEDGSGYLIHGWAKSRSGIKNRLTLHRLSPDNRAVIDEGENVIDGDRMEGWTTIEGPKLYKRAGYYYIFAPAGGVRNGYQAVFRSRQPGGPYENRIVLNQGTTAINGPHQGAWVDTPAGEHWFVHFQEMPVYGRVVHLQPLRWKNDWPEIGEIINGHSIGEPVLTHRKPVEIPALASSPITSDEFNNGEIGLQWQWQANPQAAWTAPRPDAAGLRLNCRPHESAHTLWSAPNLLLQKFAALEFEGTTVFNFSPGQDEDVAGLLVFGHDYAWIGMRWKDGRLSVVVARCVAANQGGAEKDLCSEEVTPGAMHLKVAVKRGGLCQFFFSKTGEDFVPLGPGFQAASSSWVGAKVGLFAAARGPRKDAAGHVDVDWVRIA